MLMTSALMMECIPQWQIQLPQLESLPLFTRIPCRITVICTSKSMSVAHSIDVTKFTFPRNPKPPDIQLDLRLHSRVKARGRHRSFVESYGLLGGFGRVVNPVGINALSTDPVWIPNQAKPNKGKWSESVTYNSSFLLQCPTPVNTRLIKTTVSFSRDRRFEFTYNWSDSHLRAHLLSRSRQQLESDCWAPSIIFGYCISTAR
jgi:hypothetical protein